MFMGPYFARKNVPYRTVEDFTIVYSGRRKLVLNKTGTAIWSLLDQDRSIDSIAAAISESCRRPVDSETVRMDVEGFLDGMLEQGIVKKNGVDELQREPETRAAQPAARRNDKRAPVVHSVQEECMTPDLRQQPRSLLDALEQLYWRRHYVYKMHLELTYRCNFRCVQCYNATHKGAESELTVAEWQRILGELADLGCYFLTFTGGEVFVRKDALDILQAACKHRFTFRISTNGSLIDERTVERLKGMQPFLQGVDVSFYGADRCTHDTLARRAGSYEKTLAGVRLLAEARVGVLTKFITMRDNFEGIPQFEETMKSMGIKYAISTESLIPRTDRVSSPLIQLLTDDQYRRLLSSQNVQSGAGHSQSCKPGHIRGAITPDGSVSPCEWLTDLKLGNVREQSLKEIWYGRGFLDFRKVFEQESDCPTCNLRTGCRRCPAHSYLETGNLLSCAPIQRHNAELFRDAAQAAIAN